MIIPIVNSEDKIIGHKKRSELLPNDIYRVCGLTIINNSRQILLRIRAHTKKHDPGKLSFAAAGTVEQGETYVQGMVRETYEELGIHIDEPIELFKFLSTGKTNNFFSTEFLIRISDDTPIVPEATEVIEMLWKTKEEIDIMFGEHPEFFVQSFWDVWKIIREKI